MREFADEFFADFVHEFKYEIRTNSYEFFALKIGYVTNGLYCTVLAIVQYSTGLLYCTVQAIPNITC